MEYPQNSGRSRRLTPLVIAALFVFALVVFAPGPIARAGDPDPKTKPRNLLDPKSLSAGWTHFSSDDKKKLTDVWELDTETDKTNPVLICKAKQPSGYLRTKVVYTNYQLDLEWKYPKDPNCNSGVLIHTGKDKIWPASIQVQLHRPFAGSIFPLKGAETSNTVMRKEDKLDTGKWHSLKIVCLDETVSVWINTKKVGEVNGCDPTRGYIALQCEGFEIHFRGLKLTPLVSKKAMAKPGKAKPAKKQPKTVAGCLPAAAGPFCVPCDGVTSHAVLRRYDGEKCRYVRMKDREEPRPRRGHSMLTLTGADGTVYYYQPSDDVCRRRWNCRDEDRDRRRRRDDDDD